MFLVYKICLIYTAGKDNDHKPLLSIMFMTKLLQTQIVKLYEWRYYDFLLYHIINIEELSKRGIQNLRVEAQYIDSNRKNDFSLCIFFYD